MTRTRRIVGLAWCLLLPWLPAAADDAAAPTPDEQFLKAADVPTDGRGLLGFFRGRTVSDAERARLRGLVRLMGDNSFPVRERASRDLAAAGLPALPLLREATRDADVEIARRAEECLHVVEAKDPGSALPAAAARLLALRKPAGAAAALLGYLPAADNDVVAEEVRTALAAVATSDPEADKALVAALDDPQPVRRATAAGVLCRVGSPERRAAARRLLHDPDAEVRLQVALALATRKDRDAVPVLIELLAQLPAEHAWPAEDLLHRLAGEQAPHLGLGRDQAAQVRCRDAWAAWWREHGAAADLARLEKTPAVLGYTLLVLLDAGRVLEVRSNGTVRWQIDGLGFPLDAQVLPGDRVLVAEHNNDCVTERNRRGEVLWRKEIDGPIMAQRLPNGHTFLANRDGMYEVDHRGQEVGTWVRPNGEIIMKAQRLPDGNIACVTAPGVGVGQRFVLLTPEGKMLRSFPVAVKTSGGRIDVLPNGNVLVPEMDQDRVVEVSGRRGEAPVWEVEIEQPIAAVRLPNGNTLVTSMKQLRAVEFDRTGRKEVWEYKDQTRVTRAFRR
jgi:HEAT repeats